MLYSKEIASALCEESLTPYRVGGLLYTPASNASIARKIVTKSISGLTSVALCLEDSIQDDALAVAEAQLFATLEEIKLSGIAASELPLVFVRVRSPQHLKKIAEGVCDRELNITGFVLPKFDLSNAGEYLSVLECCENELGRQLYVMPTLESRLVSSLRNRVAMLEEIKSILDTKRDNVLNIRVGGNDFCSLYGLRRNSDQTIYDIRVISDILANILNVFSVNYVVSGPVWEYFGGANGAWEKGLRRELRLDRLNGFIGKTAIHPVQLPVIRDSLTVSRSDYEDARMILRWNTDSVAVSRSHDGSRMNELKCHGNWAFKTMCLAEVYGVKDDAHE